MILLFGLDPGDASTKIRLSGENTDVSGLPWQGLCAMIPTEDWKRRIGVLHEYRPVLLICGVVLSVLACSMILPALTDVMYENDNWWVFLASAAVTLFFGLSLVLSNMPDSRPSLNVKQAFLLTVLCWILAIFFCSLPFYFSASDINFAESIFETTSGLTATGATAIVGLDTLPHGLLMWRALLHWFGGIGIVLFAVALLPVLKIGGIQIFRMEYSDKTEKAKPRISQIAGAIFLVYLSLTIVLSLLLFWAGMTLFEGFCHAASILATGGFSTSDMSLGKFDNTVVQWIAVVGMIIGGMTFTLFIMPWRQSRWMLLRDSQIRTYLTLLLFMSLLVGLWRWSTTALPLEDAMRVATFSVVAIVTTTGLAVDDYSAWGGFAQIVFFFLTFTGACTGSTTGGIKIFRYQVLFSITRVHLKKLLYPNGIFVIDFNRQNIPDTVVRSVLGFMMLYVMTFCVLSLILTIIGLDFITSLSGAASVLGNVGPGLGDIIGPAGSYKPLPDMAKWFLSMGMLLGRLELMPVFVLLTRAFWRE